MFPSTPLLRAFLSSLFICGIAVVAGLWTRGASDVTAELASNTRQHKMPSHTFGLPNGEEVTQHPFEIGPRSVVVLNASTDPAAREALVRQLPDAIHIADFTSLGPDVRAVVFDRAAAASLPDGLFASLVERKLILVALGMPMSDLKAAVGPTVGAEIMAGWGEGREKAVFFYSAVIIGVACDHATIGTYGPSAYHRELLNTIERFTLCQHDVPRLGG